MQKSAPAQRSGKQVDIGDHRRAVPEEFKPENPGAKRSQEEEKEESDDPVPEEQGFPEFKQSATAAKEQGVFKQSGKKMNILTNKNELSVFIRVNPWFKILFSQ
jgi:hypothetical protein